MEDELESTTEQNQGVRAFAAEMTAEQREHEEPLPGPPEPFLGESGGNIRLPSIPEQPTLEEASPSAAPVEDQPLHAHENEEWYQKWLRRQRNQPSHTVEIGAPPAAASSAPPSAAPLRPDAASASSASAAEAAETIDPSEEQRVCPDDGKTYTFSELQEAYKGEYSEEDLKGYWRDAMILPGGEKVAETSKEDYKQEEWYQKWLRRQQNKNRQIIEIG